MIKFIVLTIWCTCILCVVIQKVSNFEYSGLQLIYKIINTLIWLGFVYWFCSI